MLWPRLPVRFTVKIGKIMTNTAIIKTKAKHEEAKMVYPNLPDLYDMS